MCSMQSRIILYIEFLRTCQICVETVEEEGESERALLGNRCLAGGMLTFYLVEIMTEKRSRGLVLACLRWAAIEGSGLS